MSDTVRLVGPDRALESVSLADARERARAAGMELVAVSDDAVPVCRLVKRESRDDAGKKLHDPLAACCAIDPSIGEWAEVEMFRERGEWGSRLAPGSGVQVITGYDPARFVDTFTAV
ncbi:MAG: hypothetical protein R3A52_10885 [Polyangiales bacterium]